MGEIKKKARNPEEFLESAKAAGIERGDKSVWTRRYKRGEPCKLKNVNLPLSMIERCQEIADEKWDGNFSALMVRIIRDYLDQENHA
jgi:hypothetical protein